MINSTKFKFLENRIIIFTISAFILSFFFEQYFKFELGFFRFSVVEVIFVFIVFLSLLIYKFDFIRFIFKFDRKNIFEIIIYTILLLKLIKYSINFQNYYNLYELCIWIYMIGIYLTFKFYLNNNIKLIYYIENSFIALSLILSLHIIYSYLIYKLGYESNILWEIRDETYYPYIGKSNINFRSLLDTYSQAAQLVVPGFLFLFSRFKSKLTLVLLIIFYCLVLYLIKSKFLIIFFSILGIFLIIRNLNLEKMKLIKFLFLFGIIATCVFYFILTHFIVIEKDVLNTSNFDLFKKYYFSDFTIHLNNYDIYGSLFLKLKYTAIEIAKNYNFIFFDNLNYYNHKIVFDNFGYYEDPHSDYFGALANYGILGFIIYLSLPIYLILEYLKNFNHKKSYEGTFVYFLLIMMIFIESMVVDFFHTQFIWIIFAMYIFCIYVKKDNKKTT